MSKEASKNTRQNPCLESLNLLKNQEFITALENGKERGDSLMSNYCGYSKIETSGSVAGVIFGDPLLINNFQLVEEMSYDGPFKVKKLCLFFSELFLAWNRYV